MRLLSYTTPERRVDLFGIVQGRVFSSILIGTFASVIKLGTSEEVLVVFSDYAHNPRNQHAIHSTLQLTAHGISSTPRFGTPPSITTPQGDVIPLSKACLYYDYITPRIWK